jgi:hypothetical protein
MQVFAARKKLHISHEIFAAQSFPWETFMIHFFVLSSIYIHLHSTLIPPSAVIWLRAHKIIYIYTRFILSMYCKKIIMSHVLWWLVGQCSGSAVRSRIESALYCKSRSGSSKIIGDNEKITFSTTCNFLISFYTYLDNCIKCYKKKYYIFAMAKNPGCGCGYALRPIPKPKHWCNLNWFDFNWLDILHIHNSIYQSWYMVKVKQIFVRVCTALL